MAAVAVYAWPDLSYRLGLPSNGNAAALPGSLRRMSSTPMRPQQNWGGVSFNSDQPSWKRACPTRSRIPTPTTARK